MIKLCDKNLCNGCGACFVACPAQAIEMKCSDEGFPHPEVILGKCVGCGICEKSCPVMTPKKSHGQTKAFGAYNKNDLIRAESSSGGVFTLLAQQVLGEGGVVYGAAFTPDFKAVKHIAVEKEEDLSDLRGSKYVQSQAFSVFSEVKKHLKEGRKVLFSGTPCQVEGLRGYLAKRYDNLLCVDIICHGVPSQKVWQKYIEEQENQAGARVTKVSFTDKTKGWNNRSIKLCFDNGKQKITSHSNDSFMKAFSANISLRESCSDCVAKKVNRLSDITIADFWGVNRLSPGLYDNKGTSLLLVHNEKGEAALEEIKDKLNLSYTQVQTALSCNGAATHSAEAHPKRSEFFSSLDSESFDSIVTRLVKTKKTLRSIVAKIVRKIIK